MNTENPPLTFTGHFIDFIKTHPQGNLFFASVFGLTGLVSYLLGHYQGRNYEFDQVTRAEMQSDYSFVYAVERPKGISFDVWSVLHKSAKTISEDGNSIIFAYAGYIPRDIKKDIKDDTGAEVTESKVSYAEIQKRENYASLPEIINIIDKYTRNNPDSIIIIPLDKLKELGMEGILTTSPRAGLQR